MPPAISDESDSGGNPETVKMPKREKKPVVYSDNIRDEEEDDDEITEVKGGVNGEADEDEEGDEDLEEDEYVVEKIMSHFVDDEGQLRFEVKWEGFEKKSDRTWEPEENLRENASAALEEYFASIGGRERLFEDTMKAMKTKKRGRPSSATPTNGSAKRSRKNGTHPLDSSPPASASRAREAEWKPPAGSWEDAVESVDACQDEESGNLIVYLTWKNGKKTQHPTQQVYKRCPQQMLRFYERCVRIVNTNDDKMAETPRS